MRRSSYAFITFLLFLSVCVGFSPLRADDAAPLQPPAWELEQNEFNPFCNNPGSTQIRFSVQEISDVVLQVWSPDTTAVVRVLVDSPLDVGYHQVVWDGRDDLGDVLPVGDYPYSMTASQLGGGPVLFEDMLVATIDCLPVISGSLSWGVVKALFQE